MFVKWSVSQQEVIGGSRPRLNVYLAESSRIDGRPRQRIVSYLASTDISGPQYSDERYRFWAKALLRLWAIPGLTDAQRDAFIEDIARVVPRFPTPEESAYLTEHLPEGSYGRSVLDFESAVRDGRDVYKLFNFTGELRTPVNWPPQRARKEARSE